MEDYTPSQLANMFKVSRTTVYAKFTSSELQEYLHKTPDGMRLAAQGLPAFRLLLANSRAGDIASSFTHSRTVNFTPSEQPNTEQVDVKLTTGNPWADAYIARLEREIEKKDQRIAFLEQWLSATVPLLPAARPGTGEAFQDSAEPGAHQEAPGSAQGDARQAKQRRGFWGFRRKGD